MSGAGSEEKRPPVRRLAGALAGSSLLMDSLACVAFAAGWATAILGMTQLPDGTGICLLLALGAVALVTLCTLRWWLAPALAGLLLLVAGIMGTALQRLGEWLLYASSFLRWLALGAPAMAPYSGDGSFWVLQILIVLGLALLAVLLVRRLFSLPLLAVLCGGAVLGSTLVSGKAVSAALCFCAVGLIIVLPRSYAARLERRSAVPAGGDSAASSGETRARGASKQHAGARVGSHAQKNQNAPQQAFSARAMRPRMQLVALIAAVLAACFAVLIIPENTNTWRFMPLRTLVEDVGRLLGGPFASYPAFTPNFGLAGMGFGAETGRLGGPAQLAGKTMLEVRAPRALLLKGRVLDYYTGTGWAVGVPDGDLRYQSLFWHSYQQQAFAQPGAALGGEAGQLYASLTEEITYSVAHWQSRFNSLFYQGEPLKLELNRLPGGAQAYFNLRGELYFHNRLDVGKPYTVTSRVWRSQNAAFEEEFARLETLATGYEDKAYAGIAARYTQLPETLPLEVGQAAALAAKGGTTPYGQARALARWLAENNHYTLEVDIPPEDEDFVAHFLRTGEGYCTYYASAMAVMARCLGLPSRYVQGFALQQGGAAGLYRATGRTAHAWAEIYFSGIGWLSFDPLAWDAAVPLNGMEDDDAAGSGAQQAPPQRPDEQIGTSETAAPAGGQAGSAALLFMLLFAGAGSVVWLAVRYINKSKSRAFARGRVARRHAAPAGQLLCYYKDILRQLKLSGLVAEPGETLGQFAKRIDRRLQWDKASFAPVAEAVNMLLFAEKPPGGAEVEQAYRYHQLLEDYLRTQMGKGRYFLWRALPKSRLL